MAIETALITGASSGIGLDLARLFAADKTDLVLVARRKEKLEELAGELRDKHRVEVTVLPRDLADPAAPAEIHGQLQSESVRIDVLVNNAGFGALGPFADLPLARQMEMVRLNVAALTELTGLLLPPMIERNQGGVLNVASTAAFQPGPNMAVYYAGKAYVLSFSEALAEELAGTGVAVTCLCPGATHTEFQAAADMEDSLLFKMGAMDSRAVARAGYVGFRRKKPLVIPGVKNRLGAFSIRFAPRLVVRKLVKKLNSGA